MTSLVGAMTKPMGFAILPPETSGTGRPRIRNFQPGALPPNDFPLTETTYAAGLPAVNVSLNTTCNVTNSAIPVTLPRIGRTSLPTAGSTAGVTPFQINLDGCTYFGANYTTRANFTFTTGPSADLIANAAGTSPAANVFGQILTESLVPIANNGTSQVLNVTAAGGYVIRLFARYQTAGGGAGAGNYTGNVAFFMTYL